MRRHKEKNKIYQRTEGRTIYFLEGSTIYFRAWVDSMVVPLRVGLLWSEKVGSGCKGIVRGL